MKKVKGNKDLEKKMNKRVNSYLVILIILLVAVSLVYVLFVKDIFFQPVSQNVILTWDDNSINEDGFNIERRISGSLTFSQIASLTVSQYSSGQTGTTASTGYQVTYSDSSVSAGTAYDYQVIAFNSAGLSDPSNIVFNIQIPTQTTCGNGFIENPETCDDGNVLIGDGCSDVCQIETGYECISSPSVCVLIPTITSISPGGTQATALLNTQTNTVTINGNNFVSGAQVFAVNQNIALTFVNSNQLTFTIPNLCPDCLISNVISVVNYVTSSLVFGQSNEVQLYITSPTPTISNVAPLTMVSNSISDVVISGNNFLSKGTIISSGIPYFVGSYVKILIASTGSVPPIYLYQHNGLILNAQGNLVIPSGSFASLPAGNYDITVLNPNQVGTAGLLTDPSSNTFSLIVSPPAVCSVVGNTPTFSFSTTSVVLNRGTQTLEITGTNLQSGAKLTFVNPPYEFPLTIISPTQATATINFEGFPPSSYGVSVTNMVGTGTPVPCPSSPRTLQITEDTPSITSIVPSIIRSDGGAVNLNGNGFYSQNSYGTLSDVGFISSSGEFLSSGDKLPYNVISPTQITINVPISAVLGTYMLGVRNPGGAISNAFALNIVAPVTPPGPPGPGGGGGGGGGGSVNLCGNSKINTLTGETCDDGNRNIGDGCSNTCKIETGYICSGIKSVCVLKSVGLGGTTTPGEQQIGTTTPAGNVGTQQGAELPSTLDKNRVNLIFWIISLLLGIGILVVIILLIRAVRAKKRFELLVNIARQ